MEEKKDEDKFRGGRGSEVKKKGQKWKMEGKSIKNRNMSTAWYESMSGLMKKYSKNRMGLKYHCSAQAMLLKNRKAYIPPQYTYRLWSPCTTPWR